MWRFGGNWHANRYRRGALAELDQLLRSPNAGTESSDAAMALLVRRTALAAFPRETIAPLVGTAWLAFLDHSYGGHEFSAGVGRGLEAAPHARAQGSKDVAPLSELVRRWVRKTHVLIS